MRLETDPHPPGTQTMRTSSTKVKEIEYPEDNGETMTDNTLQRDWALSIEAGLRQLFSRDDNVFVAADLLWYPVQGDNKIRTGPDTLVAFGRPKGRRGSYRQ